MTTGAAAPEGAAPKAEVYWQDAGPARLERWRGASLFGATVWLTGLSGSGKSTVASALADALAARGSAYYVLDGDNLRFGLNVDLGFSPDERVENVRRVGEVARLFADAGVISVVPVISPYRAGREAARRAHEAAGVSFIEVHMATSLDECERRDTKGLYARARRGELTGLTGVDDPYEAPIDPELTFDQSTVPEEAAARIVELLDAARAAIEGPAASAG